MIVDISKYYRKWVPYSIRHGIRVLIYRLIYVVRGDRFITINEMAFTSKNDEIYREKVQLFYIEPQTISKNGIIPKCVAPKYEEYDNSVFKFKQVSCYGASDIIKLNDKYYLYEVRDFYRNVGKQSISTRDVAPLYVEEQDYFVLRHYKNTEHIEKGILLSSYFAGNYYHFTFQCLAKLRLCEKIDKDVPLLVNKAVAKYLSFQQLLEICNVDKREMIMLSDNKQYDVDELYYISPQMISVPNYRKGAIKKPDDDLYCVESLNYLRKMMLPHMDTEWEVPENVVLQRRFTTDRRGYNEEECEQLLAKYGFVGVRPETLTLGQQIALFNKAKCIVGATGAAFTNLVYGSTGCKYVVLKGAKSEESIFSSLAAFYGAQLVYLCDSTKGELRDASQEHGDFHIDVNDLKDLIEKVV